MEATNYSEMLVSMYQTTRRHIPEDYSLNPLCWSDFYVRILVSERQVYGIKESLICLLHRIPTGSGAHPAFYPIITGGKGAGA
jgi:hypothetical protein